MQSRALLPPSIWMTVCAACATAQMTPVAQTRSITAHCVAGADQEGGTSSAPDFNPFDVPAHCQAFIPGAGSTADGHHFSTIATSQIEFTSSGSAMTSQGGPPFAYSSIQLSLSVTFDITQATWVRLD